MRSLEMRQRVVQAAWKNPAMREKLSEALDNLLNKKKAKEETRLARMRALYPNSHFADASNGKENFDDLYERVEKKRKTDESEKEKKKKPLIDFSDMSEKLTSKLGEDLSTAFPKYNPDQKDYIKFLERAGDKIMVPSIFHAFAERNPVTGLLKRFFTFYSSKEYSATGEGVQKVMDYFVGFMKESAHFWGLPMVYTLPKLAWDSTKLAARTAKAFVKAPYNLIKNLMKDTKTAEWLVDNHVVTYDMEINEDFFWTHSHGQYQTLSEFTKESLYQKPKANMKDEGWSRWDSFKNDLKSFCRWGGGVLSIPFGGIWKPFEESIKNMDEINNRESEKRYANQLLSGYFQKYVDANSINYQKGMREIIQNHVADKKDTYAKSLREKLISVAEGNKVDLTVKTINPQEEGFDLNPDMLDAFVENMINKQVVGVKDQIEGFSPEEKKLFVEQTKLQNFTKSFSKENLGEMLESLKPEMGKVDFSELQFRKSPSTWGYSRMSQSDFGESVKNLSKKYRSTQVSDIGKVENFSITKTDLRLEWKNGPMKHFVDGAYDVWSSITEPLSGFWGFIRKSFGGKTDQKVPSYDEWKRVTNNGKKPISQKKTQEPKEDQEKEFNDAMKKKKFPNPNPEGRVDEIAWSTLNSLAGEGNDKAKDMIEEITKRWQETSKTASQKDRVLVRRLVKKAYVEKDSRKVLLPLLHQYLLC